MLADKIERLGLKSLKHSYNSKVDKRLPASGRRSQNWLPNFEALWWPIDKKTL